MDGILEKLAQIRGSFMARLPAALAELDDAAAALDDGPDALETIVSVAHRINGSAGTFGLTDISEAASGLETYAQSILRAHASGAVDRQHIAGLIDAIKQAAAQDAPPVETDSDAGNPERHQRQQSEGLIYLAEHDAELVGQMAHQLEHYGYEVRTFGDPDALTGAMAGEMPSVIVTNISFPDSPMGGIEGIKRVREQGHANIPVIFISSRTDFDSRLQAVRAGASAYLAKPFSTSVLLDQLDRLAGSAREAPIRIVVVEDDGDLADYYSAVLRDAGIETKVIDDPRSILRDIADFRPDVILMDFHMPGYSGVELTAIIRQHDSHAGVPIIYLSSESDLALRHAAMHAGGDGFISKPVSEGQLVGIARFRAQRSREMRALMTRDGLTGLLNHVSAMERLETEIGRASRENKSLALALIDIDLFKSVNDTYGHLRGDQVLKSLGHLLQQRFRKTDLVGRYGGEEFIVILPGTDAGTAARLMDDLRITFSNLKHSSDDGDFSVTFSCGISSYPACADKSALLECADAALYRAKEAGRNLVIVDDLAKSRTPPAVDGGGLASQKESRSNER